jgi:hypothetical protein
VGQLLVANTSLSAFGLSPFKLMCSSHHHKTSKTWPHGQTKEEAMQGEDIPVWLGDGKVLPAVMDWTQPSVWWDRDALDVAKLDKHQIKYVYVDAHALNSQDCVNQVRAAGRIPGLFFDPHWFGALDPAYQAQQIYGRAMQLLHIGEPVMLDLESLTLAWTTSFLRYYHGHMPKRPTSVTFGPGVDTSVIPASYMQSLGMHAHVQLYDGQMHDAPANEVVPAVADIIRHGLAFESVHYFYGGAGIPWNAACTPGYCIFTLSDIPA